MGIFEILLGNLNNLGFFQFILPFLLILAIIYGILASVLKDIFPQKASALISIVVAFFVMNYSGWVGVAIANFFTALFGYGMIILAGILIFFIFLGLAGIKPGDIFKFEGGKGGIGAWAFALFIIFIGFLIFIGAGGLTLINIPTTGINLNQDFLIIVFFVIMLVLVMWWMGRSESAAGAGGGGGQPQGQT